jgi:NADH dehydrogenase
MPFSYQPGVNDIQKVDLEGITNLIEAAKANQVSHFVYTSVSQNALREDCPLVEAKSEVERRLKESGLTYTILHPSAFMEVWLSPAVGFDAANGKVAIYGTGENPISWIAVHDITQFAVASLDHPAAKNTVLELGGPEAVSALEAVRCFEQSYGRSFELQFVPMEALQAQQAAATDPMQQTFSVLMQFMAKGDAIEMSDTLKTFGIRPTSLEEHIKHTLTPA